MAGRSALMGYAWRSHTEHIRVKRVRRSSNEVRAKTDSCAEAFGTGRPVGELRQAALAPRGGQIALCLIVSCYPRRAVCIIPRRKADLLGACHEIVLARLRRCNRHCRGRDPGSQSGSGNRAADLCDDRGPSLTRRYQGPTPPPAAVHRRPRARSPLRARGCGALWPS
jgi:hypothetical protein